MKIGQVRHIISELHAFLDERLLRRKLKDCLSDIEEERQRINTSNLYLEDQKKEIRKWLDRRELMLYRCVSIPDQFQHVLDGCERLLEKEFRSFERAWRNAQPIRSEDEYYKRKEQKNKQMEMEVRSFFQSEEARPLLEKPIGSNFTRKRNEFSKKWGIVGLSINAMYHLLLPFYKTRPRTPIRFGNKNEKADYPQRLLSDITAILKEEFSDLNDLTLQDVRSRIQYSLNIQRKRQ